MAKLRKWVSYRTLERPYTRISKYRKKGFIKVKPNIKITRFIMGNQQRVFDYELLLVAKTDLQIRHNALESARQTGNRHLEQSIGKENYMMMIRKYPHHIVRENPLASGAGADRLSTGMAHSFGKPIGSAAQVKKGEPVFEIECNKSGIEKARQALKRCSQKLPNSYSITLTEKVKKEEVAVAE